MSFQEGPAAIAAALSFHHAAIGGTLAASGDVGTTLNGFSSGGMG
jgi:hypothetical protein